MYKAVVELLTEIQPLLTAEDVKEIANRISDHIRAEAMMAEETKKLLGQVADPRVRIIVSAIHADEVAHHNVLTNIERNIVRKEVYTEEEFRTQVWRGSPWRRAPRVRYRPRPLLSYRLSVDGCSLTSTTKLRLFFLQVSSSGPAERPLS
ncbi:MAG: hypothetical protein QXL79_02015 [Sulfolobales archaeon]